MRKDQEICESLRDRGSDAKKPVVLIPCLALSALDIIEEALEEVAGVVGAWGGFGVVLDAEDGERLVGEALDGLVVEVGVGDFYHA